MTTVPRGERAVDHAGDSIASHVTHITTAHFVITYSPSLSAAGQSAAHLIAGRCEQDYTA
jgi:hypothetical protein